MAFDEDLAGFVSTDDFGVVALYNGATEINVIFDTEYFELPAGRAGAESRQLRALAVSAHVPNAVQGDTLEIDSIDYEVIGVQRDPIEAGPGFTMLVLEKQ